MNQKPLSLLFNEHAKKLSFPSIYLGKRRVFKINNVTPFLMAMSEIRIRDRRGVKSEHVLYMAMKIMRDFFNLNLMAYSPKVAVIDVATKGGYDEIPIAPCGDLNIDLRSTHDRNL